MMIIGDIGGTKTNLAIFQKEGNDFTYSHFATYPSQKYPALQAIIEIFIQETGLKGQIDTGSFAIAGPVINQVCKTTNLPWIVDASQMVKELNFNKIYLLNDLESNAWAIEILSQKELLTIYSGLEMKGNRAILSPGTGLGEAGIYWDGKRHLPFACEGGHCDFGPRNDLETNLFRYLYQKFGHVSYERILSGPGIYNIYQFYRDYLKREDKKEVLEEFQNQDPAKVITKNALNSNSELCSEVLDLFISILGAEASNCALKFMAIGGIFLGGGIPPKILPKFKESIFLKAFLDKGRFHHFLEKIPVHLILDDKASLKGAAYFCRKQSKTL